MQAFFVKSTYRGPAGPISLKNVHWTFFRALNAPESQATLAGEGKWSPGSLKAGRLSSKCNSERRDLFHGSLDNGAPGQANEANEPTGMLRMVGQPTKAMPAQPIVKGLSRHKPLRLNLNQGR